MKVARVITSGKVKSVEIDWSLSQGCHAMDNPQPSS